MKIYVTSRILLQKSSVIVIFIALQLMAQWSPVDSQAPSVCPDGWSCHGTGKDWWAESQFADTYKVSVKIVLPSNAKPYIGIDCQFFRGKEIQFPKGFLKNFTWQYIGIYEFYSCPIPRNSTFAQILQGHQVEELRLQRYTLTESDSLRPEIFEGLTELAILHIKNGNLSSLSKDFFFPLPNLQKLSLDFNHLSHLPPKIFSNLKKIQLLSLSNNHFTHFVAPIKGLDSLIELYLDFNQIKNISREFFASTPLLEVLDLQMNNLTYISSDTFHNLRKLTSLKLFTNQLQTLPSNVFEYQYKLQELDISFNPDFTSLPDRLIHNLTSLTTLNIGGLGLEIIPDTFFPSWRGNTIQILFLYNNKLKSISSLDNCGELITLDLSSNLIKVLQDNTFSNLTNLSSLNISDNLLETIEPSAFSGLSQLKSLNLHSNHLATLPTEVFTHTKQLEQLILKNNKITFQNYPENHFELPSYLKSITLSGNEIVRLPAQWFIEYPFLEVIDLSYNKIAVFNFDDFQPTGQNTLLDLSHNQISRVELDLTIANQIALMKSAPYTSKSNNKVTLGYNPFVCDCQAMDLLKYYQFQEEQQYQFDVDLDFMRCKVPPQLENTPVSQLKFQQLYCDLETECHHLCKCQLYPDGRYIEVDCRNQKFKEPPGPVPHNTSVLLMDGNLLESLEGFASPKWANLTRLHLSNNLITDAKMNNMPKKLTLLDLHGNRLSVLSNETLRTFDDRPNMTVYLQGNPWICDCSAKDFQSWLNANVQRLGNVSNIRCNDTNSPIYSESFCLPIINTKAVLVGATIISLLLAVGLATAGIGYYRYHQPIKIWLYAHKWCLWFVTENEIDRDKKYDAFISFSQEDAEFVACHLLPGLEQGEPPYKVCIHYRDWLAGEWIPDQIIHSVQNSRRTIVVLTKNFIRSVWGRLEFKSAHHQALQDQTNRIIIIVYGDLPPTSEMDPELKAYVKFNTYLKWGEPWFWQKLRYAMPHSSLCMPSKRSATIAALSSSITSAPSRIPTMNGINNSISNCMSGDKFDLVCTTNI